ncbi:MAG: dihydrolipoyl dehydrogenase [Chloroflexi bacterium]|nr:dihydrolipoyl dehydrogenase [Chloroflexota bacterium]
MEEKDVVIIGGGPGGYVAALRGAQLGARVALVDKGSLGGTCLSRGCIPTKALIKSVGVLLAARRAGQFGVEVGDVRPNFQKMMARKDRIVATLVSGIGQLMKANGVSVYRGEGRILSPHQVKINDKEVAAGKIVIATGSEPARLPVPGSDLPGVVDTDGVLRLNKLPASLVIIGGGYVGVEFAGIFNGLGSKVTIVEMLPALLETVDEEISALMLRSLHKQGIQVELGAKVEAIEENGELLKVVWDSPDGERSVEGKMVLMATGRTPYTGGLGLAEIGVEMDGPAVIVDGHLETKVKGVYAIGDVLGKHMLAHVASYEGEVAVENALGGHREADYHAVPSCVFTQPEIAAVGITGTEACQRGLSCKVSKFPFAASGRAAVMDETAGLVKMICDARSGAVLGIHIMGPNASDLIAEGALAMQMGATARDIASAIHAHPTLPEAMREAALGQLEGSIHFHTPPASRQVNHGSEGY